MRKIEELLSIIDKRERHMTMVTYASALGVDCREAKDSTGEYIEEKLVLLIYDAEQRILDVKKKDIRVLATLIALAIIIAAIISAGVKMMVALYEGVKDNDFKKDTTRNEKKESVLTTREEKPDALKTRDGQFQEFYNDGHLHYDYTYKKGKLLKRVEYSQNGEVIGREYFPDNK